MKTSKLLGLDLTWLRQIINDTVRGEGVFCQPLSHYLGLNSPEAAALSVVLQVEHELESGKRLPDVEYTDWDQSRYGYLQHRGHPQWRLFHVQVLAGLAGIMFECVTGLYSRRDRKRICKAYRGEFLESAYILQSDRRYHDAAALALAHYLVIRNTSCSDDEIREALWAFRQFWGARSTRLHDVAAGTDDPWLLAA